MDRRFNDMSEMYRQNNDNRETVADCINTNFCVSSPYNMNNGILTMAFVDMQPLDEVYPLREAFCNGTLFPNLNKPFYGGRR